jgi:hypothetical protein
MFFSIGTVSTLLAIWSIWIKVKPNEKAKQQKTGANQMEFQNVYVLQIVKKITIYYINLEFGSAKNMFKNLDEN